MRKKSFNTTALLVTLALTAPVFAPSARAEDFFFDSHTSINGLTPAYSDPGSRDLARFSHRDSNLTLDWTNEGKEGGISRGSGVSAIYNTPEITAFLFSEVLCGETISLTPASVILYALILPFVTLTAVCMLQTLLNLVVRPAISFLICFVTYIAAAYFPIEWLVGNGAMVMRYQLFDANGLSYRKELVFTLLLMLLSIGAGYLLIQRKDLISLEK